MTAPVVPLRPAGDAAAAGAESLAVLGRHLDRCKLADLTVRAYKRQAAAHVTWLPANAGAHGDAFADLVRGSRPRLEAGPACFSSRTSAATVN